MAEEIKTQITPVSADTEAGIKRNTAEVLPDNPTSAGMKAADIKAAFFKGLTNGDMSLLSELKRVIDEANSIFEKETTALESIGQAVEGKLDRQSGIAIHRTVYAEGTDGNVVMIPVRSTPAKDAIVSCDDNYRFTVASPQQGGHPINKTHFDKKSNNSLYAEVTDMERRVKSLEHSASGNIYSTVTVSGCDSAFQVDNACPYGILTRLGGSVSKITVGLPFKTSEAVSYSKKPITDNITPNSVSMPIGEAANIRIPCQIKDSCTVTVIVSEGNQKLLNKAALLAGNASQIGGQTVFENQRSVLTFTDAGTDVGFVCITKQNQGVALTKPFYINDIRVLLSDPKAGEILYVVDEIDIPVAIQEIDGYGEEGAYIDFIEKKFCNAEGEETDISDFLTGDIEVVSLLPSAIIKFTGADGSPVVADCELSYKNKV